MKVSAFYTIELFINC